MRYAIIEDGKVKNIVESNHALTREWKEVPFGLDVAIGDTYTNKQFHKPNGNKRRTRDAEELFDMMERILSILNKLTGGNA